MKTLLVFLFVSFSLHAVSQTKNVLIKISPLPLIDEVGFPAIQAGAEFKLSEKINWYNELGIKYRKSYYDDADTNFLASKGFKVKTEFRYYFKKHTDAFLGRYIAANAFFLYDVHNTSIGYFYQKDTSMGRVDDFGVRKKVFGINLLYGFQRNLFSERFLFELYAGVGIRFRAVNTVNQEYDKYRDDMSSKAIDVNVDQIRRQTDAHGGSSFFSTHTDAVSSDPVTPNLTFGIRFSYKL